ESFPPANGAADPGERVRMQFNVRNVGTGNTRDLEGTLVSGNGVVDPDHKKGKFRDVQSGGAPVGDDFKFTADGVCGATIQPTIALSDKKQDLGTVSFPVTLGTTAIATTAAAQPAAVIINDTPRVSGVALA